MNELRTEERWKELSAHGAVWRYQGDLRAPHAILRSGLHTNGFIDALRYLSFVRNLTDTAGILAMELNRRIGHTEVDWVFGSPMAAIQFAGAVAPLVGAKKVGFTEKVGDDKLLCRHNVQSGETVLLIEEMSTSGRTPQRGINAILAKCPEARIIPYVGAYLIRCTPRTPELRDAEFVPIIDLPSIGVVFDEWKEAECPLCKQGSRPIGSPKKVWDDFLRTMEDPTHPVPSLV